MVDYLKNTHNRHSIAHPRWGDVFLFWWVENRICIFSIVVLCAVSCYVVHMTVSKFIGQTMAKKCEILYNRPFVKGIHLPGAFSMQSTRVSNTERASAEFHPHTHVDYMTWKHFLHYWHFVRGIHQSLVDSRHKGSVMQHFDFLPLSPPGWRGIVVTVRAGGRADWRAGGRAGGCQTCGTHISVTAWWIFSVRSSIELSRPVVVHCHAHLPICPIWACPWAENLSNLPQIGSRLCGSHISETAGWIYPI